MQLEITGLQGDGFNEITATHNGESLVFSVGTYGKVKLAKHTQPEDVFLEINDYWRGCSMQAQDTVWAAYQGIKSLLDDMMDPVYMDDHLKEHVASMYSAMPFESFTKFVMTYTRPLYIPSDVKDSIDERSRQKRAELTYLKADYIDLATLALAVRPMLPIWGEYIEQGGQASNSDMYKEIDALNLLKRSSLVHSAPVKKLDTYIQINSGEVAVTLSSLWKGMGSAEIPEWLFALVMVRRMTIVPLTNHAAQHSIIANIYRYIRSKLKPTDRRNSDKVTEKRREGEGRDEDDKTSMLEEYKIKQRIADGDVVLFTVYTENMAGIAQTVDPTFNLELLQYTTASLSRMVEVRINPHQIRLAQWVLAPALAPRAFDYLPKVAVNRLLATAQALLWHWGFLTLACLLQVDRVATMDQSTPNLTPTPAAKPRIGQKYKEKLIELYPHSKPLRVSNAASKNTTEFSGNVSATGINNVTKMILTSNWQYLGPPELRKVAQQPEGQRLLVIPPTIKNEITELVIHIAQQNQ